MTATLTDESAFLAAIREAPQDDALRLIFADWLDGNGDEARGEFIRVQCELARIGHDHPNLEWLKDNQHNNPCRQCSPLHGRERELLRENAVAWLDTLPPSWTISLGDGTRISDCRTGTSYDVKFSRGFLSHVTLPMESWIGRECKRCRGSGSVPPPTNSDQWLQQLVDCVYCSGTGRVGAHGPAIVRSPVSAVEVVTFSDKRPLYFGGKWWWRLAGYGVDDSHDLPKIVWWDHPVNGFISHDSESAALDAASRAAVTWATSQNRQSTIQSSEPGTKVAVNSAITTGARMEYTLDEALANAVTWLDRAAVAAILESSDHDTASLLRYLRQQSEACRLGAVCTGAARE